MSYLAIDPVINSWTQSRKILLLKEDSKLQRRYFYMSSKNGETFQVVIEPERDGLVRVDAHLIETWNGDQAHYIWEASSRQFMNILELSYESINKWFAREL